MTTGRKKISKLKKCSCGATPVISKGKVGLTAEIVWVALCNNCARSPATGNYKTRIKAIRAWNRGVVSESLFKGG